MTVFLSYIFLGLSLAAPIGPINAAQLNTGIKSGFWNAWLIGLGAVTADAIYMIVVYLGVGQFLTTPFMKTFLWSFGCFVLIYTGIESILLVDEPSKHQIRKNETKRKSFLSGFLISLLNPLTILFWLGIYGSILAQTATKYGVNELILYSSGIFIGLFTWDLTMAGIASSFRNLLTNRILFLISFFSGLALIGFGIYFGFQAIQLLNR